MNGAIIFSGQYGSTAQYAHWISDATGLPVFDVKDAPDPARYDFLVLGSSVIVYKLTIGDWVERHLPKLLDRPVILYSVSGAPAGEKLDGWIKACLPASLVSHMRHVALRGRMDPKTVSLIDRIFLLIGAWGNKDPEARKQELEGFDFMDQSSVEPIVDEVRQLTKSDAALSA